MKTELKLRKKNEENTSADTSHNIISRSGEAATKLNLIARSQFGMKTAQGDCAKIVGAEI